MGFDFNFRTAESYADTDKVVRFIGSQNLGYPRYQDWVVRTHDELSAGYKNAIVCESNGVVVADVIWQRFKATSEFYSGLPHGILGRAGEVKNIRVDQRVRGRFVAQFMLRNAECEALSDGIDFLVGDARSSASSAISLFLASGYSILFKAPLYEDGVEEIVLGKYIRNPKKRWVYEKGVLRLVDVMLE